MIPIIVLLLLFFFVLAIFKALVFNFSVIHMYFKKIPTWASIKTTFKKMKKAKLSVFVFLLAKLIINIVVSIGGIALFLSLALPFLLLALPFVLIFWSLISAFGWILPIIIGMVIVAIVFMTFYVYVFSVIFLPVSTFARYFSIRNYKALMK